MFRELIGSLVYLSTRTRRDISTAVSTHGKFTDRYEKRQWRDLQHLIRYIKETQHYGPSLKQRNKSNILEAWCDVYWDRDDANRISRTGFIITLNGNPVLCKSKVQTSTAPYTADKEFHALAHCIRDILWFRDVLSEIVLY